MKIKFGDIILPNGATIRELEKTCSASRSCAECKYANIEYCKRYCMRRSDIEVEIPQTVKHGRWEYDEKAIFIGCCRCSECGTRNYNLPTGVTDPYQFPGSSYCPHCGAKMGEKEEA